MTLPPKDSAAMARELLRLADTVDWTDIKDTLTRGADLLASQARDMARMREALEAHAAWSWAENKSRGTFDSRMELCSYSEWLTERALHGEVEDYSGVPHMIVWPFVGLQRASADEAKEIVKAMLAEYREAREALAEKGA